MGCGQGLRNALWRSNFSVHLSTTRFCVSAVAPNCSTIWNRRPRRDHCSNAELLGAQWLLEAQRTYALASSDVAFFKYLSTMPAPIALKCTLKELTSDTFLDAFNDDDWSEIKAVLEHFIAVAWGCKNKNSHDLLRAATEEVALMPGENPPVRFAVFFKSLREQNTRPYNLVEVSIVHVLSKASTDLKPSGYVISQLVSFRNSYAASSAPN